MKDLAKEGINVVGLARRPEKIEEFVKELGPTPGKIHAYKCDVTDLQSIKEAFKWIESEFGFIHILVNNAGVIRNIKILTDEDVSEQINEIIQTNFTGLVHVTREAFKLMKKSNDYGMIVNINSNAGHKIPFPSNPNVSHNVYHGTKFAVTATTEVLRQELICQENDKIRVTVIEESSTWESWLTFRLRFQSLSPGVTSTDIFESGGFTKGQANTIASMPAIKSEDISKAVLYLLSTPVTVNVTELTIKHVSQKF